MTDRRCCELPVTFHRLKKMDILRDRSALLELHVLELLSFVGMAALGMHLLLGKKEHPVLKLPFAPFFAWMCSFLLLALLYQLLHVMTHAAVLGVGRENKIRWGYTRGFLFAHGSGYYSRRQYFASLLAPLFLWGAILLILQSALKPVYSPMAFLLQIVNVVTSVRDVWLAVRILPYGKNIRVRDEGLVTEIYGERNGYPE